MEWYHGYGQKAGNSVGLGSPHQPMPNLLLTDYPVYYNDNITSAIIWQRGILTTLPPISALCLQ